MCSTSYVLCPGSLQSKTKNAMNVAYVNICEIAEEEIRS